jgi:hypothetical protein
MASTTANRSAAFGRMEVLFALGRWPILCLLPPRQRSCLEERTWGMQQQDNILSCQIRSEFEVDWDLTVSHACERFHVFAPLPRPV